MCDTCSSGTVNEHSASDDVLLSQVKQRFQFMTKAQALKEFRQCDCVVRGDVIATRENWNNYTDFLCRDRQITDKQYNTWSNPF
tara:strand:+ start:130 stop:381 length:252 start_codon:yes stop_codon:yes gene_type:complete